MISREEQVKCPRCSRVSSLGAWDDKTYGMCTSREMRRAFKSLTNEKSFKQSADTFYICPKCNSWSRGSQLIIESEDKELRKLGRQSVVICKGHE